MIFKNNKSKIQHSVLPIESFMLLLVLVMYSITGKTHATHVIKLVLLITTFIDSITLLVMCLCSI